MADRGKTDDQHPIEATRDAALEETLASGSVDQTMEVDPNAPLVPPHHHARGDTRGRYVVLDLLGEGAMGAVYAAYDPELDRRVALKVLHPEKQVRSHDQATQRLIREAKAMARLSHPNVIQVFDVGTFEGEVYIAMEYVMGHSLATWEANQDWQATLEAYRQAARGLAHAHENGVVHRDFKPDNCLVGADGRVRVIDFGIARQAEGPVMAAPELAHLADSHETAKTRAGTLLGTPAYMSREQLEGRPADARSDQFAFCVSLYEALYGQRPFDGDTLLAIMDSVVQGKVRPIPKNVDVPEWVAHVILRGLRSKPDERFADMNELVEALTPPEERRASKALLVAVVAVLAGLSIAALIAVRNAEPAGELCGGLETHLEGVWDEPRRDALREAFTGAGLGYGQATFDRVSSALDARSAEWVQMRTDACEATRVHGESTEAVLELRMACLDRRLRELDSAVDVLTQADEDGVQNAVQLVSELPPIGRCADVDRLESEAANEPPAELREAVDALRARLTRSEALEIAGAYAEAETMASEAIDEAREIDWSLLVAEALVVRAKARISGGHFQEAEDDLFEAVWRADQGGDLATEAQAWIGLIFVVGIKLRRYDEGLRWARFAESTLESYGEDPLLSGQLRYNVGLVRYAQGQYVEALAAMDEAVPLFREVMEGDSMRVLLAEGIRANALSKLGRHEEAIETHRATIAQMRASVGDDHPRIAVLLNNLATALRRADRLEECLEVYEEALALKRRTLGEDHPSVAVTLSNLGMLEHRLGHFDRAAALLAEARALRGRTLGETHGLYAYSITYEAQLAIDRRRVDEAVEGYRQALNIQTALAQPVAIAQAQAELAHGLLVAGEVREAEALARSALASLREESVEPSVLVNAQTALALSLCELDRSAEAVEVAEAALAAHEAVTSDADTLATTRLALGRALEESGQNEIRGVSLLQQAEAAFAASAPRGWWGLETARAALAE